jgi:hypothetical protein
MKEIAYASMQATDSTVDVTAPQAATKIMAGMADRMAVWQTEWLNGGNGGNGRTAERMAELQNGGWNGQMADRMAEQWEWRTEWSNGGNGRMAGMADGMVEWQTEMATYILFMVHTDDDDDTF